MMNEMMAYTGALASVWIVVGIYVASRFYPNYSHRTQFCSELGAFGSPTQKLSPLINNYPLGLLFILFGVYVATQFQNDISHLVIGIMISVHGLATWVTGYFPMDKDPYTQNPSSSCKIHSLAGVFMLLSLIIAPGIVVFHADYSMVFRLFSVACLAGCFYFSFKLGIAFKDKTVPGIYQRLSYGAQILWLFGYSILLAFDYIPLNLPPSITRLAPVIN